MKSAGILSVCFYIVKGREIFRKWQRLLHGLVVSIRKLFFHLVLIDEDIIIAFFSHTGGA